MIATLLSFEVKAPRDHSSKCCSWAQMDCRASMVLCLMYKGTASSTPSTLFYSFMLLSSVPALGSGQVRLKGATEWGTLSFSSPSVIYRLPLFQPALSPRDFVCIILLKMNAFELLAQNSLSVNNNIAVGGLVICPTTRIERD